jgi:hypothetical protein
MTALGKKAATAAVALVSVGAIAVAPSVTAPPPPAPAIELTAQVQQTTTSFNPFSVTDWLERIVIPPSLGAPFPTPQFLPQVAPTSLGNFIINAYNAIEPWVRYGFDLAAYAVGWIPYVGWLAPQITIFYNLGERITRSIAYNLGNFLNGQISFGQGLTNVAIDTINSFIFFANDQIAFWLPPLPPIPPLPGGSSTLSTPAVFQAAQTGAPVAGTGVTGFTPAFVPSVTINVPTQKTSAPTGAPNPVPKIDPFSIATSALTKSNETTTPPSSPLSKIFNTPGPLVDTSNLSAGNPNTGGLIGAVKHLTDSLTGGVGGGKRG